jgi:2-polyprenyl-3-methyl-5-hydroxy-6-metoxy-1,4-benzoquinol methylase
MKEIKKGWDEFWAEVIGIKIYGNRRNAFRIAKFQADHIIRTLKLKKGACLLDIGCGAGFHCIELARRGFKVTGIDISKTLISYAKNLASKRRVKVTFSVKDMRELDYKEAFNAITILNQTFPVFDDSDDLQVLRKCNLALKTNGKLYIQSLNPSFYSKKFRAHKEWSRQDNGYRLISVNYNALNRRVEGNNIYILDTDKIIKEKANDIQAISFRLLTTKEWVRFLKKSGFKVLGFYGSQRIPLDKFKRTSNDLIIAAHKIK